MIFINKVLSSQNVFFKLTDGAKRLTHISLSSFLLPLIFLAGAAALTQFVLAPLILVEPKEVPSWIREIFGLFVLFGLIIGIVFLWIKFFEGRTIISLGFTKDGAIKKYLSGFAFGLLINSLVIGIMTLLGNIEVSESSSNIIGIDAIGIVLIFLLGFLVQGAGEEVLARGWMMQVIGARYKPWLGVLISTIVFTLLHMGNAGVNPTTIINLVLVSVLLCLFVLHDGSLWFACAWHSSWNWMLGNFYGLSVSGTREKVSIFDLNTTGNELLSGGGFGPEASIVTTAVLFLTIIWYVYKILRKNI